MNRKERRSREREIRKAYKRIQREEPADNERRLAKARKIEALLIELSKIRAAGGPP